jgi:hypothetical protein
VQPSRDAAKVARFSRSSVLTCCFCWEMRHGVRALLDLLGSTRQQNALPASLAASQSPPRLSTHTHTHTHTERESWTKRASKEHSKHGAQLSAIGRSMVVLFQKLQGGRNIPIHRMAKCHQRSPSKPLVGADASILASLGDMQVHLQAVARSTRGSDWLADSRRLSAVGLHLRT